MNITEHPIPPELEGLDLVPGSWKFGKVFAKLKNPQDFNCVICGDNFKCVLCRNLWLPRCRKCLDEINSGHSKVSPYPMPPMYQRDGSKLDPRLLKFISEPLPALATISGAPGRGKTAQTHHVCSWYHKNRKKYVILSDRDLAPLKDETLEEVKKIPLVIIDELGKKTTDAIVANLCEIIDQRLPYDLKTLIVTNLGPAEMQKQDARLISRLGLALSIYFGGEDKRLMK